MIRYLGTFYIDNKLVMSFSLMLYDVFFSCMFLAPRDFDNNYAK